MRKINTRNSCISIKIETNSIDTSFFTLLKLSKLLYRHGYTTQTYNRNINLFNIKHESVLSYVLLLLSQNIINNCVRVFVKYHTNFEILNTVDTKPIRELNHQSIHWIFNKHDYNSCSKKEGFPLTLMTHEDHFYVLLDRLLININD